MKFPRIDLPRSHITRLFLTTDCGEERDCDEAMRTLLGDRDLYASGTPYTLGGKKHLITARVDRLQDEKEEAEDFLVRVSYDATEYPNWAAVPREDQREKEFLAAVLGLNRTFEFACNIEFTFSEVDESSLWFPLPSRIGGTGSAMETFEIIGVDAVKIPGESLRDSGYSFSMRRHPQGEVFLDLYFPMVEKFTQDLPRKATRQGLSIASRLVGKGAVSRKVAK